MCTPRPLTALSAGEEEGGSVRERPPIPWGVFRVEKKSFWEQQNNQKVSPICQLHTLLSHKHSLRTELPSSAQLFLHTCSCILGDNEANGGSVGRPWCKWKSNCLPDFFIKSLLLITTDWLLGYYCFYYFRIIISLLLSLFIHSFIYLSIYLFIIIIVILNILLFIMKSFYLNHDSINHVQSIVIKNPIYSFFSMLLFLWGLMNKMKWKTYMCVFNFFQLNHEPEWFIFFFEDLRDTDVAPWASAAQVYRRHASRWGWDPWLICAPYFQWLWQCISAVPCTSTKMDESRERVQGEFGFLAQTRGRYKENMLRVVQNKRQQEGNKLDMTSQELLIVTWNYLKTNL